MYKCEICGKEYKTIAERAKCEAACVKKLEEDAKKAAEAKKKAERDARRAEVDMAIEKASKLLDEYMKAYGSYRYNECTNSFDNENTSLHKLLQYLLF